MNSWIIKSQQNHLESFREDDNGCVSAIYCIRIMRLKWVNMKFSIQREWYIYPLLFKVNNEIY